MILNRLSKNQLLELAEKMKKDGKDTLIEEVKADMRGEGYFQLLLFHIKDGKKTFIKACESYKK